MQAVAVSPTSTVDSLAWAFARFERFCGLLDIVPKAGARTKLRLNDIQRAYCAARTPRDIALKPRQIGFTTLEQARDVFVFLTRPGVRVVATCQSISDHAPLRFLAKTYDVMFTSLRALGIALPFESESVNHWKLRGSDSELRIIEAGASEAAARKKGRAGTINRLHITETAFFEYGDDTLNAMLECVPKVGEGFSEIISESTPNGASGTYYRQVQEALAGQSGYRLHFYPWYAHSEYAVPLSAGERIEPRTERETTLVHSLGISPEQLKWYQRKLAEKGSQELVDQEYPSDRDTCFVVPGRQFFDSRRVDNDLRAAAPPVATGHRGAIHVWQMPKPDGEYAIGADPSEGTGGDAAAAVVFERGTGQHVATLHGQFIPWDFAGLLDALGRRYNGALLAVERNNHGYAVLQALRQQLGYPNLFKDRDDKFGWLTTEASRAPMLDALDASHRREIFKTNDKALLGQMRTFVVTDTGKAEAAKGAHDDLVIAAAIGWAAVTRRVQYRDLTHLPPA